MEWSTKQDQALDGAFDWMRTRDQVFKLFGYAGTGKTTLAKHLVAGRSRRWLFAAYTGKAAYVLRQRGCDGAQTLHSLIYRPSGGDQGEELQKLEEKRKALIAAAGQETPFDAIPSDIKHRLDLVSKQIATLSESNKLRFGLWENSPLADDEVEGVVIDEVSMVDERLARDLESFGKKILVLGDPFQLPPVGAAGHYTNQKPDIMLTEVHRQGLDSGILNLATHVREGGDIRSWRGRFEDCEVVWDGDKSRQELEAIALSVDQVLVGRNKTRAIGNLRHRGLLGRTSPGPVEGDRLICLRNDREHGLFNGSQWTVSAAHCDMDNLTALLTLDSQDGAGQVHCESWLHHMVGREDELKTMTYGRRDLMEFDWSYRMTVHKAQGSQWSSVLLLDESAKMGSSPARWLYTGITRASEKLVVVT